MTQKMQECVLWPVNARRGDYRKVGEHGRELLVDFGGRVEAREGGEVDVRDAELYRWAT